MKGRAAFAIVLACIPSIVLATTVLHVPADAQPSPHFNVDAATNAWLATMPPSAKARSDAYFEGGYWLMLWDLLYGAGLALLFLYTGLSARMRDFAERVTPYGPLRTMLYWTQFALVSAILAFPLTAYEGYVREHQYGLATQTFGPWLADQFKGLLLNLIFGAIITAALFGIVRRMRRTWWIWGAVVTTAFLIFGVLIAPVYIVPLFNKVTRLDDPTIVPPVLRLARANGIPARDVYVIDASRQTTRISANVSGFASTMRITLNDNLLRRGSPEEIQAVLGHEMGHYVLNHVYKMIFEYLVIIVVWFAALQWSLTWALARFGARWRIRDVGDTAVVPLVFLISSFFFFLLTPINNTLIRTQEYEADMYGLNAARQPDGFAQAAVDLSTYRKMSPGPVEEWILFDHPSGRTRIRTAMRWKAENLNRSAGEEDSLGRLSSTGTH